MRAFLLFASALLSLTLQALGAPLDGNELLRGCIALVKQADGNDLDPLDTMRAMHTLGYLQGFTDSHAVGVAFGKALPLYSLPESGVEGAQLGRIVEKYLKEHPVQLHESARVSVFIALAKAFPPKKSQTSLPPAADPVAEARALPSAR